MTIKNILFISRDKTGETMAGTAQRYTELAGVSARYTKDVGLLAPPGSTRPVNLPENVRFLARDASLLDVSRFMLDYDTWFSQSLSQKELFVLRRSGARFIYDGYDPVYLENLERLSYEPITKSALQHLEFIRRELRRVLLHADKVAYANPQQKNYLLGQLQAIRGLGLNDYGADHVQANIFIHVPYGLHVAQKLTTRQRDSLRAKRRVSKTDQLLLWGGGVWNWFDPLSLLEALEKGYAPRNTKVLFPGFRHPDSDAPQMKMARDVQVYLKSHPKLRDRVIVDEGWIPYGRRHELFGIADVGVSLHFDSLETELSFRTRVLEYLANDLPILSTSGDFFANEIASLQLGHVVPPKDSRAIGVALKELLQTKARQQIVRNIQTYRELYLWDRIIQNLLQSL